MIVLPLAYLGDVAWFAQLIYGGATIDVGEHYVGRSCRNRCRVMLANGLAALSAPVVAGGNRDKLATGQVRLDESKRWRHTHWMSIRSGYGSAPYWEAYEGLFRPIFERRFEFLYDWNIALMEAALTALGSDVSPKISKTYLGAQPSCEAVFRAEPYWQVFGDRHPFAPNLSIIDPIFCLGPEALEYLRKCYLCADAPDIS